MTREEGLRIAKKWEGKVPRKYLDDYLSFINCSEEDFYKTIDSFTNPYIFKRDGDGNFIRDNNNDLIKLDYGFDE